MLVRIHPRLDVFLDGGETRDDVDGRERVGCGGIFEVREGGLPFDVRMEGGNELEGGGGVEGSGSEAGVCEGRVDAECYWGGRGLVCCNDAFWGEVWDERERSRTARMIDFPGLRSNANFST